MTSPLRIGDVIDLRIYTTGAGQQAPNTSTPCLIAYHGLTARPLVETFRSVGDMIAAGHGQYSPAVRMAQALAAQPNPPASWKVARRATPPVQAVDLTCLTDTVGKNIRVSIMPPSGVEEVYSRACAGGGIPAEATALAALITAGASAVAGDITATGVGNDVQIRQGVSPITGQIYYFDDLENLDLADVTADPGLAADLTAIRAFDDDWYYAALDSPGKAEQVVLAAQLASTAPQYKCVVLSSQDSAIRNNTALNLALVEYAAGHERTTVWYSSWSMASYPGCALIGQLSTLNPGASVAALRTLVGVTPEGTHSWDLSATQLGYLRAARCNAQLLMGGVGYVDPTAGYMSASRWIDERVLLDWLAGNIPVQVFNDLAQRIQLGGKVPYVDPDAGEFPRGSILKVLGIAEGWGGVVLKGKDGVDHFSYSYTPAASQLTSDKLARVFRGVRFGCLLAGAVQLYKLEGYFLPA